MSFPAVDNFISSTLSKVDAISVKFVSGTFNNIVSNSEGVITLVFTLYIIVMGYRFLTHTLDADISTITRKLIIMLIAYALLMNWELYNLFMYNIFTREPLELSKLIVGAGGTENALNKIFSAGIDAANRLFASVDFHHIMNLFYGLVVAFAATLNCIFALCLLIYAKVVLAVMLALAPIFVLFMLWDFTKSLFTSWLHQLLNFALVPIVTTAILAFMLQVVDSTTQDLAGIQDANILGIILPFTLMNFINFALLKQVLRICASLSGGMTMQQIFSVPNLQRSRGQEKQVAGKTQTEPKAEGGSTPTNSGGGSDAQKNSQRQEQVTHTKQTAVTAT